jgi:hypothetical protein
MLPANRPEGAKTNRVAAHATGSPEPFPGRNEETAPVPQQYG